MPNSLKLNLVAMFGFAPAIILAEYKIAQLRVSPFGQDPCDAVWHFALFVMLFTLVVSTLRTIRPDRVGATPGAQYVYVIRSQQAFVLALLIALSADIVALTRHPSMWINADWRNHLLAWLSVLVVVAAGMELLVRAGQPTRPHAESWRRTRAKLASLLAEGVSDKATFVNADLFESDFSQATVITLFLLPDINIRLRPKILDMKPGTRVVSNAFTMGEWKADETANAFFSTTAEWYALLIGNAMGTFAFWIDAHRTGAARPLLPILRFVGPVIGLLIVYAFLAEPLGLTISRKGAKESA